MEESELRPLEDTVIASFRPMRWLHSMLALIRVLSWLIQFQLLVPSNLPFSIRIQAFALFLRPIARAGRRAPCFAQAPVGDYCQSLRL